MHSAPLTIGIEEEYQLIDPVTGELAAVVQQLLHDDSIRQIGDQVKPEFLQSQIEIGSAICHNVQEARAELVRLRREVNSVGRASRLLHPGGEHTSLFQMGRAGSQPG